MRGNDGLGRADLARVDAVLDRVDAVDDLETFGRVAAAGVLELLPGISASYNEVNPVVGRAFAVIDPEPDESWWSYYTPVFEQHLHEHPFVRHVMAGGDGAARTWDELPGGDRFRSTELYRRFYAPLGIETQLSAQLPAPDGIVVGLAINRGPDGFDARDRLVLDVLRSHLVRAYRRVQLAEERDRLGRMLGDDGWQVVLVDDDGVVVSTTGGATNDTTDLAMGCRPGSPLPAPLLDRFRATAGERFWTKAQRPDVVRLTGLAGAPDVAVVATLIRNRVPPHVLHVRSGQRLAPERLRALGLSERQAAVARLVAAGAGNQAIATDLGISPATVKKHLEHIYRVLGVHTRAAAVAALSTAS